MSAINEYKMIHKGKYQLLVDCNYAFNALGQNTYHCQFSCMVDMSTHSLSSKSLVQTLYRKRGDLPWTFSDLDAKRVGFAWKAPNEGISAKDMFEVDVGDRSFIIVPNEDATQQKRAGRGKRSNQLMNEACKTVSLTLVMYDAEKCKGMRERKQQIELEKVEAEKAAREKAGDVRQGLFECTFMLHITSSLYFYA